VIARNTGGTPEAMGGAGILFDDMEPVALAALMQRALTDRALRADVLAGQERRMAGVRARDVGAELRALMKDLA
jgi:glycosyltransferase involved in cell wall biosynthesis